MRFAQGVAVPVLLAQSIGKLDLGASAGRITFQARPAVDPASVIRAGISMRGKTISEREVPDSELEDHIRALPQARKRSAE